MTVELLYVDDCPNHERLLPHLRDLLVRAGVEPEVELRRVSSEDEALALRFLGSPTLRVDGRDVEPEAEEREDYGLKCRLYRTGQEFRGVPPDEWIHAAICARPGDQPRWSRPTAASAQREVFTGRPMTDRLEGAPAPMSDLHRTILRAFIAGRIPTTQTLAQGPAAVGVDGMKRMLNELERRDVIRLDPATDSVAVAYPFSGTPTEHRVTLRDTGTQVFAMCAIDALGIPFLARELVTVRSSDAVSNEPIEAQLDPDGALEWEPREAVVIVASCGEGPSAECCCPYVNFAAAREPAEALLSESTGQARVLDMPDAVELGRLIFGDLLTAAS